MQIGKYADFILNENILLVGQILGFRYMTGKNKLFTLDLCPIREPEDKAARGVEVLCSFHDLKRNEHDDIELNFITRRDLQYFNIKEFFCHITIKLKKNNDKKDIIILSEESKTKLNDLIT